jgi:release factor glutamine methyltransferase
VTVLEAIQKTAEFFERKGLDSPRLQAELLLAHTLKLPRMKLYLSFDRGLGAAEVDGYRELVRRRGQHEPLQHLVGSVSFCGLEFACTPQALIPRPETELLAQFGGEFLRQHPSPTPTVLDFGTGTGCLAITLAAQCPRAHLWALDISGEALALARENARRHGLLERLEFIEGDGCAALAPSQSFDLLISNPPYIPSAEIGQLQPEVRDHDPRCALDGGADGLDFYRRLAKEGAGRLNPGGRLMVELGDGQAAAASEIFSCEKWIVEGVRQDYSSRDRFLLAGRP